MGYESRSWLVCSAEVDVNVGKNRGVKVTACQSHAMPLCRRGFSTFQDCSCNEKIS